MPGAASPWKGNRSKGLASEFICSPLPRSVVTKAKPLIFSLSPGDIGGQMGLFIGASILTILELFDYIYEVSLGLLVGK